MKEGERRGGGPYKQYQNVKKEMKMFKRDRKFGRCMVCIVSELLNLNMWIEPLKFKP